MSDGQIQNGYEIRVNNTSDQELDFEIGLEGLEGAELDLGRLDEISLVPGERVTVTAQVRHEVERGAASPQPFHFVISDRDGAIEPLRVSSQFSHR